VFFNAEDAKFFSQRTQRFILHEMKERVIICLCLLFLSGCAPVASNSTTPQSATAAQTGQHSFTFEKHVSRSIKGKYLLFLPQQYGQEQKSYPLIMYLHGGSLRGDDLEKVRTLGLPQMVERDKSFPFIVVSPLCPAGEIWTDTEMLLGILDEVISRYSVDTERIYLTGHSMGGRGAFYLAYKHPERFAAIAPLSAIHTIPDWAGRLKDVPVRVIHGAKDVIVPAGEAEAMVKALKAIGGNVKFTSLPDRDHFILDVYEDKQLYEWFLQHQRKAR
jgi:predicted peptidase